MESIKVEPRRTRVILKKGEAREIPQREHPSAIHHSLKIYVIEARDGVSMDIVTIIYSDCIAEIIAMRRQLHADGRNSIEVQRWDGAGYTTLSELSIVSTKRYNEIKTIFHNNISRRNEMLSGLRFAIYRRMIKKRMKNDEARQVAERQKLRSAYRWMRSNILLIRQYRRCSSKYLNRYNMML